MPRTDATAYPDCENCGRYLDTTQVDEHLRTGMIQCECGCVYEVNKYTRGKPDEFTPTLYKVYRR